MIITQTSTNINILTEKHEGMHLCIFGLYQIFLLHSDFTLDILTFERFAARRLWNEGNEKSMIYDEFDKIGEYFAAGAFGECDRSLFYRNCLGLKNFYEKCSLMEYYHEKLYPSGKMSFGTVIFPHYLQGFLVDEDQVNDENAAIINAFRADFCKYHPTLPEGHDVAGNMWCHSMPNYKRIINEGLLSYFERIKKITDSELKDGLTLLFYGVKAYIERCVTYLESIHADEKLIRALKRVPMNKAENFYEAVVSWNFVMYLDSCDNLGCVDRDLSPFYQADREEALALLENLFRNLDDNDGYSMALGNCDCEELTLLCLEAIKGKRRPMTELFVDEETSDAVWKKAFSVVKTGGGQPAFYNKKTLLCEIRKNLGVTEEDAESFCGAGCTESTIAGMSCVGSMDAGINLLLVLEQTMHRELQKATSFTEFYRRYLEDVFHTVDEVTDSISENQKARMRFACAPMRTLLTDDCIAQGLEFYHGGARYSWSIVNFAGIINVIDSLLVIKNFIFDEKKISPKDLLCKLNENDPMFLQQCRNCKISFGVDHDEANQLSGDFTHRVFDYLKKKKPFLGKAFIPASIQFRSQAVAGKNVGATPDGRATHTPLCDSLGAIMGKDQLGPTALLKSVTSLDLKSAIGIPVLNFNIDNCFSDEILKALLIAYLKMGGIQMQITCVSKEQLLLAHQSPDDYKNIIVRVGGYSEYFYRLDQDLRQMIIKRTIY